MITLMDLAQRQHWSSLTSRSRSHPQEIPHRDAQGFNVFHWACFNQPPLRVIRSLLHNAADDDDGGGEGTAAALTPDNDGLTPLHYACCCHASPGVVYEIVARHPEAAILRDTGGWTPLHYVYSRVGRSSNGENCVDIARILLRQSPSIALWKSRDGRCPLMLLLERYENEVTEVVRSAKEMNDGTGGGAGDCSGKGGCVLSLREEEVKDFWDMLVVLVYAIYRGSRTNSNDNNFSIINKDALVDWPLLHTIVRMDSCSELVIQMIILQLPEQVRWRDENGRLPLHEAISHGVMWNGGVRCLLEAYPEAILEDSIIHVGEHLYPYILEAMGKRGMLGSVFEVLRGKPNLVSASN